MQQNKKGSIGRRGYLVIGNMVPEHQVINRLSKKGAKGGDGKSDGGAGHTDRRRLQKACTDLEVA